MDDWITLLTFWKSSTKLSEQDSHCAIPKWYSKMKLTITTELYTLHPITKTTTMNSISFNVCWNMTPVADGNDILHHSQEIISLVLDIFWLHDAPLQTWACRTIPPCQRPRLWFIWVMYKSNPFKDVQG
jgi:hypothetical protein